MTKGTPRSANEIGRWLLVFNCIVCAHTRLIVSTPIFTWLCSCVLSYIKYLSACLMPLQRVPDVPPTNTCISREAISRRALNAWPFKHRGPQLSIRPWIKLTAFINIEPLISMAIVVISHNLYPEWYLKRRLDFPFSFPCAFFLSPFTRFWIAIYPANP